jgi:hypothetical protein
MDIMKSPYSQLRKPGSGEGKFLISEKNSQIRTEASGRRETQKG